MGSIQAPTGTDRQAKKYLSVNEVAHEYGNSPGFWRKRVFLKQIPYVKAGRSVKIRREDLDAWHATRLVAPGTGVEQPEEVR